MSLLPLDLLLLRRQDAPPSPAGDDGGDAPQHHINTVVAFIIGLSIVTLASVLNAAGLNLTKLDHVSRPCTVERRVTQGCMHAGAHERGAEERAQEGLAAAAVAARHAALHVRAPTLRVAQKLTRVCRLSQLIGSTLALRYMRAGASF